jgi:hypothetical protein
MTWVTVKRALAADKTTALIARPRVTGKVLLDIPALKP